MPDLGCGTPSERLISGRRNGTGANVQAEAQERQWKSCAECCWKNLRDRGPHGQRPWGRGQLGTSKAQQGEEDETKTWTWSRTLCVEDFGHWKRKGPRTTFQPERPLVLWVYSARMGFSSSLLSRPVISDCKNKASRITPRPLTSDLMPLPSALSFYEIRVVTSRAVGKTASPPLAQ